ncbi:MAG: 3'-5' exonuclease [Candidatus Eisenbacteria bacterium]|uniref:3'-5' exonuclease n=1 Tax=Eiseniibacteriota bacterium TaxID=2212470 RepID=A0A9D6L5R3_UNCEI|nr:3'-5' exonuclease [Candidatus Eisenbacteria bacterium]
MPLPSRQALVVVDTETTGFDAAGGHRIVEVATVAIDDGAIGETWSSLVSPDRPIPAEATAVHGIDDAMVAAAPPAAQVAAELRLRCGDRMLVFHHAAFDLAFLRPMLRRGGALPLHNPVIDTLGLARGLPGAGGHALEALTARFDLPHQPKHRALGDALTTAQLLLRLASRWASERGIGSWNELAAVSQDVLRRPGRATPAPAREPAVADA